MTRLSIEWVKTKATPSHFVSQSQKTHAMQWTNQNSEQSARKTRASESWQVFVLLQIDKTARDYSANSLVEKNYSKYELGSTLMWTHSIANNISIN